MANINQISPDGGTTVYDIEDPTARSSVNSLTPRVGIAEGKITTLQEQMLSVQNSLGGLGTASTKNSTSVVTESSDLVESGAVYDALGFGTKNLCNGKATSNTDQYGVTWTVDPTDNNVVTVSGTPTGFKAFNITSDNVLKAGTYRIFGLADTVNVAYNAIKIAKNGAYVRTITTDISEGDTIEILDTDDYDTIEMQYKRKNNDVACSGTIRNMITKASNTNPTYEPYHESVSESLAEKCDNSVIGTVEDGTKPTKAYAVGEHFIRNGKFCTCIVPVTTASTWIDSYYVEEDVATLLTPVITEATPESGITLGSQKQVCRVGNVVNLRINFTCASNLSADDAIAQTGHPVFGSINQLIAIEGLNVLAYVAPSGLLKAKGAIPAGTYTAYGTYICK